MIGGQVLDLEAEGTDVSAEQLECIHRSKTGALIGASMWTGAYLGGTSEPGLENIKRYCDRIGLAFQIIDDILDAGEGHDRDQKKATYPEIHGLEKSRAIAHDLMQEAREALVPIGKRGHLLLEFCDYLENRTH